MGTEIISSKRLQEIYMEIEPEHFLVTNYRIAAVTEDSHRINYVVSVVVSNVLEQMYPGEHIAEVTVAEAEMLNCFQMHLFDEGFFFGSKEVEEIIFRGPVNYSSFNGYTFIKHKTKGWGYTQWSWKNQHYYPFQYENVTKNVMSLPELLNHINKHDESWIELDE